MEVTVSKIVILGENNTDIVLLSSVYFYFPKKQIIRSLFHNISLSCCWHRSIFLH